MDGKTSRSTLSQDGRILRCSHPPCIPGAMTGGLVWLEGREGGVEFFFFFLTAAMLPNTSTTAEIAQVALQCASARLDGPHKMSLMLTWLWRPPGLEGTKGRGILRSPSPGPILPPCLGPDTNKRIRSPRFRQALHSRQSSEQLSVTLNDKSANLCQSLWAGIPVFQG